MIKKEFKENLFFDFSSRLLKKNITALPVDREIDRFKLVKGKYDGIQFPIVFKQNDGKNITDILDTGSVNLYLISDRTKDLLEANSITGWTTYPIRLYDKKGGEILGFHGFSVTGKCGKRDFSKCEIIRKPIRDQGPIWEFYKGVSINYWDGNDFCIPDGSLQIVLSEKGAKVFIANKISNVHLINLAEMETDVDAV